VSNRGTSRGWARVKLVGEETKPFQLYCAEVGDKRARSEVASVHCWKGLWKCYGSQTFPTLSDAAIRLLCVHGTFCVSERTWALWGRVYTASRNHIGMEQAKKLIALCFSYSCRDTENREPRSSSLSW
jgi:hypothetical protein